MQIAALDRKAWGSAKEVIFIPDGEHAWRLWVEYALVYACLTDEEKVIGAGLAFPSLSEEHGKLLAVHKLFVDPEYRGKGIGTALFEKLTAFADAHEYRCFLSVKPTNESAISVYKKLGFIKDKEIKGYYRPYEDRLIMVRSPSQ